MIYFKNTSHTFICPSSLCYSPTVSFMSKSQKDFLGTSACRFIDFSTRIYHFHRYHISSCLIIRLFLLRVILKKNTGKIAVLSSEFSWPLTEYATPQIKLENNFKWQLMFVEPCFPSAGLSTFVASLHLILIIIMTLCLLYLERKSTCLSENWHLRYYCVLAKFRNLQWCQP